MKFCINPSTMVLIDPWMYMYQESVSSWVIMRENPRFLKTVRGAGYLFVSPDKTDP